MPGLRKICKLYGGFSVCSNGKKERWVWDYKNECPIPERKMREGTDRWKESERAKWSALKNPAHP